MINWQLTTSTPRVTPTPTPQPPVLSIQHRLELALPKFKDQVIQAHAVGGDNYRVNWVVYDGSSAKIVKSQFIEATFDGVALRYEDKTHSSR